MSVQFVAGVALTLALSAAARAETESFDQLSSGPLPAAWRCGVTGTGTPRWNVVADPTAPSAPNVLRQDGQGTFPWCVKPAARIASGFVEVRFKPIQGSEDQAGGVVWRWKDGNTYYVARANALENNLSLYYTLNGRRHSLRYVQAPVRANAGHTLRVEFAGSRIRVLLDGEARIDAQDDRIGGTGAVGVWTKADSATAFDDFAFGG